jgi:glycosyltransferase involved in cell wall biosynthesis
MNKRWMHMARPLIAPIFQLRDALVRRAVMQADQLVAPSRFLIQRYSQEGFSPDQFAFLENGLDVNRIRRSMVQGRNQDDDRLRVTYLGSLAWQKGVHVLVKAFRDLSPEHALLRIFGNQDVFPKYAAELRAQANPANTSFEGTVPNDQVGRVLAATDVLAVPSLWYENSPVVIQEARAAGVPVVAADLGALSEKVRDQVDGILLAPGDVSAWHEALRGLVHHPERLTPMQANAPQPVTVEQHVQAIETLYRAVLRRQMRVDANS